MQKRTTTIREQTYQQALGPQSFIGPVMQHPQKNRLFPGQA
jgi:hypothetical protein